MAEKSSFLEIDFRAISETVRYNAIAVVTCATRDFALIRAHNNVHGKKYIHTRDLCVGGVEESSR